MERINERRMRGNLKARQAAGGNEGKTEGSFKRKRCEGEKGIKKDKE